MLLTTSFVTMRRHSTMEAPSALEVPPGVAGASTRRMSRFRPVRFQEYRMRWGCTAASVCDLHVLVPEKRVEGFRENPGRFYKYPVPTDAQFLAEAGTGHWGCCGIEPPQCEWHRVAPHCSHAVRCLHGGYRQRALRLSRDSSMELPPIAAELLEAQFHLAADCCAQPPTLPTPPSTPTTGDAAKSIVMHDSKEILNSKPQAASFGGDTAIGVLPLWQQFEQANTTVAVPNIIVTSSGTPTPTSIESRIASVVGMLQSALLTAVRAETDSLERRLADKEGQLRKLRQELEAKDDQLKHLTALLSCHSNTYQNAALKAQSRWTETSDHTAPISRQHLPTERRSDSPASDSDRCCGIRCIMGVSSRVEAVDHY